MTIIISLESSGKPIFRNNGADLQKGGGLSRFNLFRVQALGCVEGPSANNSPSTCPLPPLNRDKAKFILTIERQIMETIGDLRGGIDTIVAEGEDRVPPPEYIHPKLLLGSLDKSTEGAHARRKNTLFDSSPLLSQFRKGNL